MMEWCAAARMWRSACAALNIPEAERCWEQLVQASPKDTIWHSLKNCVAYQAGVWQNLLSRGIKEPEQPAAFQLAMVLRHTPTEVVVKLMGEMFKDHEPAMQKDLSSYMVNLMTDDEAIFCGICAEEASNPVSSKSEDATPPGPTPLRDLQLFGDCELAILAAGREEYDAHSKLVRAEYAKMTQEHYIDLRIKVLDQFSQIPKLFATEEFAHLEKAARKNIEREIKTLREHMVTSKS